MQVVDDRESKDPVFKDNYQRYSTGNAFDVAVICPKVRGMYGSRFDRTLVEFHRV